MIWGEESLGDTERFEVKALDPAEFADVEHMALTGVGAANPEAAPVAEGAGFVEVEGSSGGSAWRRRLSPHHRRAVGTFFASRAEDAAAKETDKTEKTETPGAEGTEKKED